MLNCEGPAVVNAIFDLTSVVFRHLYINSPMDVDQRMAYMQRIPRGAVIKKYKAVLLEYNQLAKALAGEKWTLGELKGISTDEFCN